MAAEVYTPTTAPNPRSPFCLFPSEHLEKQRFILKGAEVMLSFIAFILEETVNSCISCSPLYFFEFVSCTAFLFTLLLLILLSTTLYKKIGVTSWPNVDLCYTGVICVLLFISSCVFASERGNLVQATVAVVFGFFATVAFLVDFILMMKGRGIPFFSKDRKPGQSNGVPPSGETQPEEERLNVENQ